MAGRPKRRAREVAERRWFGPSAHDEFSSDGRMSELLRGMGGCDTQGYDVARAIETGGLRVSADRIRHHQRTLPRFLGSGNEHTTTAGRYEIVTRCYKGRLETGVVGD